MANFVAMIPGFQTHIVWKRLLAGLAYVIIIGGLVAGEVLAAVVVLIILLLTTNTWGVRDRLFPLHPGRPLAFTSSRGKYVGTVGKREIFTLTLIERRDIRDGERDDEYTLYRFQDPSGSIVLCFTSDLEAELGQTYQVRATVRRHEPYQGVPTTYVNRVTILSGVAEAAPSSLTIRYAVAGESHKNADGSDRQKIIRRCRVGDPVTLQREPDNPFGSHTVAVLTRHGQIGYISTKDSKLVAQRLDSGEMPECAISGIFGGTRAAPSRGVELRVNWP
jgi:hypothetical protein